MNRLILRGNECYEIDVSCLEKKKKEQQEKEQKVQQNKRKKP